MVRDLSAKTAGSGSPAGEAPCIPGSNVAAYSLRQGEGEALPLLIAVPHAGRHYPDYLRATMRDPVAAALRLEDRYVDELGEEIARQTGAPLLVAHAPRAMLDLNRAPDDVDWGMVAGGKGRWPAKSLANRRARSGLGLVPRRLPGMGEIWKTHLSREQLDERIACVHRPYHQALGRTLESLRDRWGAAVLLDLHSMPPLNQGPDQSQAAEFVLGDRFGISCDPMLADLALRHIGESGRPVAHNRPYSGGYVLDCHAAPRRGIHALQLEVSRAAYLDARLDRPGPRLAAVARLLAGLVRALADEAVHLGNRGAFRQAAE